ncbi:MAG: hypothetical protein MUC83_19185 [Pirellula sp.]|jgi:hypothetical protein|nr:hypothetical protein [Pirellula sp.]
MSKKRESDPISEDELLVRRVWVKRFRSDKVPFVSPSAFEPRTEGDSPDIDGISLYRLDCLENASDALGTILDEQKRQQNGVVSIQVLEVRSIRSMRLTVAESYEDELKPNRIPGHVVIPELNSLEYAAKKTVMKQAMLELATYASAPVRVLVNPVNST